MFKNNVIYNISQTAPTSSLEPCETFLMGVSLPDGFNRRQELSWLNCSLDCNCNDIQVRQTWITKQKQHHVSNCAVHNSIMSETKVEERLDVCVFRRASVQLSTQVFVFNMTGFIFQGWWFSIFRLSSIWVLEQFDSSFESAEITVSPKQPIWSTGNSGLKGNTVDKNALLWKSNYNIIAITGFYFK